MDSEKPKTTYTPERALRFLAPQLCHVGNSQNYYFYLFVFHWKVEMKLNIILCIYLFIFVFWTHFFTENIESHFSFTKLIFVRSDESNIVNVFIFTARSYPLRLADVCIFRSMIIFIVIVILFYLMITWTIIHLKIVIVYCF
jgi:hypothetical protein